MYADLALDFDDAIDQSQALQTPIFLVLGSLIVPARFGP
jgi:hypothetical protein